MSHWYKMHSHCVINWNHIFDFQFSWSWIKIDFKNKARTFRICKHKFQLFLLFSSNVQYWYYILCAENFSHLNSSNFPRSSALKSCVTVFIYGNVNTMCILKWLFRVFIMTNLFVSDINARTMRLQCVCELIWSM